jgi:hypothetical protein
MWSNSIEAHQVNRHRRMNRCEWENFRGAVELKPKCFSNSAEPSQRTLPSGVSNTGCARCAFFKRIKAQFRIPTDSNQRWAPLHVKVVNSMVDLVADNPQPFVGEKLVVHGRIGPWAGLAVVVHRDYPGNSAFHVNLLVSAGSRSRRTRSRLGKRRKLQLCITANIHDAWIRRERRVFGESRQ